MTGAVDSSGRALLRIRLRHPATAAETEVDAWVDTGFTGDLVLPQGQVAAQGLTPGLAVRATLADGSEVLLDTYACLLEWFGEWKQVEVVLNTGQFPLLGVGLLQERELHINYRARTMTVV
jgi:clan AA aspartic protease